MEPHYMFCRTTVEERWSRPYIAHKSDIPGLDYWFFDIFHKWIMKIENTCRNTFWSWSVCSSLTPQAKSYWTAYDTERKKIDTKTRKNSKYCMHKTRAQ